MKNDQATLLLPEAPVIKISLHSTNPTKMYEATDLALQIQALSAAKNLEVYITFIWLVHVLHCCLLDGMRSAKLNYQQTLQNINAIPYSTLKSFSGILCSVLFACADFSFSL